MWELFIAREEKEKGGGGKDKNKMRWERVRKRVGTFREKR